MDWERNNSRVHPHYDDVIENDGMWLQRWLVDSEMSYMQTVS